MMWMTVLLLTGCVLAITTGADDEVQTLDNFVNMVGEKKEVDLVVIMDRSSAIDKSSFYTTYLELVQNILKHCVHIHYDYTRVAAVTFGKSLKTPFDYISSNLTPKTKAEILGGPDPPFNRIAFYDDAADRDGNDIEGALQRAHDILFNPNNHRLTSTIKVILLVSSGAYGPNNDPFRTVEVIKADGVIIFGVGVGTYLVAVSKVI